MSSFLRYRLSECHCTALVYTILRPNVAFIIDSIARMPIRHDSFQGTKQSDVCSGLLWKQRALAIPVHLRPNSIISPEIASPALTFFGYISISDVSYYCIPTVSQQNNKKKSYICVW